MAYLTGSLQNHIVQKLKKKKLYLKGACKKRSDRLMPGLDKWRMRSNENIADVREVPGKNSNWATFMTLQKVFTYFSY